MKKTNETKRKEIQIGEYVLKDALHPRPFFITEKHCKVAKCGNPKKCVVAQALQDAFEDLGFDGAEVGMAYTKIRIGRQITRFRTPYKLRNAIVSFDKTGFWNLEPGEYCLLPPGPSCQLGARPNRWNRVSVKKNGKTVRAQFTARAIPSRRVERIERFARAA